VGSHVHCHPIQRDLRGAFWLVRAPLHRGSPPGSP